MGIVFLGPPGVGKGTQGRRLAQRLPATHISTGDILRQAVRDDTPLGRQVADTLRDGQLVGDDLMVSVVQERLRQLGLGQRFLLDGFPRTIRQAEALDRFLAQHGSELSAVLQLVADPEELLRRLVSRAVAEGRADDTPQTIAERLSVYRQQTEPLIRYYQDSGKLLCVDGTGTPDEVFHRICQVLPEANRDS